MLVSMVLWLDFYASVLFGNTPSWIVVELGTFALAETLVVLLKTRYISWVLRGTRARERKKHAGTPFVLCRAQSSLLHIACLVFLGSWPDLFVTWRRDSCNQFNPAVSPRWFGKRLPANPMKFLFCHINFLSLLPRSQICMHECSCNFFRVSYARFISF